MSYKIIKDMAEEMARTELKLANENYPYFSSDHEGWAVLYEEYLEAMEEIDQITIRIDSLMRSVFANDKTASMLDANDIKNHATYLSCEAIQLAAMAQKFIDSQKNREENDDIVATD